ncbi:T9SS type A sorting domain-containing protein, partial [Candidatus Amoebophilus asiaticus]|nr:T9SS type A sorting domain-containing protein [Candidatus Amoebophilus asiaticus]
GSGSDAIHSLQQTSDDGYILGGQSSSDISGDKTEPNRGFDNDYWIVKILELCDTTSSTCETISGTVYVDDVVDNCAFDLGETGINGSLIRATKGSNKFYTFSNQTGDYSLTLPFGSYTLSIVHNARTMESISCGISGLTYDITLSAGNSSTANNFFIQPLCDGTVDNIELNPIPITPDPCPSQPWDYYLTPCPGNKWSYCVTFLNSGNRKWRGTGSGGITKFTIDLDPNMSYSSTLSSTCNITEIGSFTSSTDPLEWDLDDDIVKNGTCRICIELDVNGISSPFSTTASVLFDCKPEGSIDGTSSFTKEESDTCSCDPNYKQVSPIGCGPFGVIDNQEITYITQFQNLGTGPAHDVVIRDLLDDDLNIETLSILSSSHTITDIQIQPNNEMIISFEGIELPAFISDRIGSSGYIKYSILPEQNIPDGTIIENNASIHFNGNIPVITNTVINTIVTGFTPPIKPTITVDRQSVCGSVILSTGTYASYFWSTGETKQTITVTNSDDYFVIVSDPFGCTATSDTIHLVINPKVLICHFPVGNNKNPQEICIANNALNVHLAHGDQIGRCEKRSKKWSLDMQDDDEQLDNNSQYFQTSNIINVYPNPYKNSTLITYTLMEEAKVEIAVYNVLGKKVKTLANEVQVAGCYKYDFSAKKLGYSFGVYILRYSIWGEIQTCKLLELEN